MAQATVRATVVFTMKLTKMNHFSILLFICSATCDLALKEFFEKIPIVLSQQTKKEYK